MAVAGGGEVVKPLSAAHDGLAACDRLLTTFARVLTLEKRQFRTDANGTLAPPLVRYAIAQLRMRLRPALTPGWLAQDPVHVSLFGGTNSGKSTLVNILVGRAAAGMHVTARFSQYPEAYRPAALGDHWLEAFPSRFAGYQRYVNVHPPRQADEDLAQQGYHPAIAVLDPEHLPAAALMSVATQAAVLWDAPDFSTTEAQAYLDAVLMLVALADVVVLAVTDESYADDRTTMLLRMVSESGVSLHVVANKLSHAAELVRDIKSTMDKNWRGSASALPSEQFHRFPLVTGETLELRLKQLLDTRAAMTLRTSIAREVAAGPALKRQTLRGAVGFVDRHLEALLRPLIVEVEEARRWEATVHRVFMRAFLERYWRDYLYGQPYGEFNQTLVRLLELLEIPAVGGVMRFVTDVVRLPFRFITSLFTLPQSSSPALTEQMTEHALLTHLLKDWLSAVKAEAQTLVHQRSHPAWAEIVHALDSEEFYLQMTRNFEQGYRVYRRHMDEEIQQRSQDLYAIIAQRPALLQALRGVNLVVDVATVLLVVKSAGFDWSDAVIGPLMAGLRRVLLEAGMGAYLETQKRLLRQKQSTLIRQLAWEQVALPVGALFPAQAPEHDLMTARRDFALIKAAALQVAQG